MRVHWTNRALEHLLAIYEYIAKDSEDRALRMVDRLTQRSEKIADFPKIGRKVPEYEDEKIREVFEEPYRLIYRILPKQIDVLAVVHGATLLPKDI